MEFKILRAREMKIYGLLKCLRSSWEKKNSVFTSKAYSRNSFIFHGSGRMPRGHHVNFDGFSHRVLSIS